MQLSISDTGTGMPPQVRDRVFATINLYLPRAAGASVARASEKIKRDIDPHARETILVVEDDERVRQLTIRRLKVIGYEVPKPATVPRR